MATRPSRVSHECAADGSWELARADPAAALRGHVEGYTGYVETSDQPLRRRELPTGRVPLIINFGVPLDVAVPGGVPKSHAGGFIARVSRLPAVTEFVGISSGIQVDLTPLGAHMFVGLPLHELPEPVASLEELLGSEGQRLGEMLLDAPGWEARFDLLDSAFARRFAAAREPAPSIQWAWGALRASAGRVEIGQLTERLGCSPRHLIQGFREQIGVAPKTAGRILRLEHAAGMLRERHSVTLARVASECGYTDQAHMTREFRALARTTPAAYAAAWQAGFLGVPEEKVNFVQDHRA